MRRIWGEFGGRGRGGGCGRFGPCGELFLSLRVWGAFGSI